MTLRQRIKHLQEQGDRLKWENLRMRLEIDVFLKGTHTEAAHRILEKYRRKREEKWKEYENRLEIQN